jgi:hypothetical protein
MSETNDTVSRELAARDLQDITELAKSPAFERYWLRRIRQKRDAIKKRFEDDPPDKCDKDEREVIRRILKEYEELLRMPATDEYASQRRLEMAPPRQA